MDPEDRRLLERAVRLSEENNHLLKKVESRAKRAAIYGFIKLVIILLPFVAGYFLLEPYIQEGLDSYNEVRSFLSQ